MENFSNDNGGEFLKSIPLSEKNEIYTLVEKTIRNPHEMYEVNISKNGVQTKKGYIVVGDSNLSSNAITKNNSNKEYNRNGIFFQMDENGFAVYNGEVSVAENDVEFLHSRDNRDIYEKVGEEQNVKVSLVTKESSLGNSIAGKYESSVDRFEVNLLKLDISNLDTEKVISVMNDARFEDIATEIEEERSRTSRRRFLKVGSLAAASAALTVGWFPLTKLLSENVFKNETWRDLEKLLGTLETKYFCGIASWAPGLDTHAKTNSNYEYIYSPQTLLELKDTLELLTKELELYPPGMIRGKLASIRIYRSLRSLDDKLGGFMDSGSVNDNRLVVIRGVNMDSPLYPFTEKRNEEYEVRSVIHHEFFHFFDANAITDDGHPFSRAEWRSLNPEGEKAYTNSREEITDKAGFVVPYGTRNEVEDRATIAEKMMTKEGREILKGINEKDPIVAAKISKIKDYFFKWSKGLMDNQYWEDLEKDIVNAGYWEKRGAK